MRTTGTSKLALLKPLRAMDYSRAMYYTSQRLHVPVYPDCTLPDRIEGTYNLGLNAIGLDRRIPYDRKRCILTHELVHWAYADNDRSHEQRCRAMTALILVDPLQYALAETMYDSTFQIATQLNVTPEIVDDWRKAVHDSPTLLEKGIEE